MEHERWSYASSEFEGPRKVFNGFALIREEKDGTEEVWAVRVLLLARCFVKGKSDGNEFAFVR